MKVLLVNGSPHDKGCTYTALREAAGALEKQGVETELLWLGNHPVPGCIACGACHRNGKCIYDDPVNQIGEKLDSYDGFIFGGPVYYGGVCSQLQAFMDRLFYSHAGKMAGKPAAAVVSCRRGGASAAFQRINMYFQMTNMIVVTSQYWNQVHGNTPEEVLQDAEGLQTMRTLAENMTYVLRCIRAGRENGVPLPAYESKQATNFIR